MIAIAFALSMSAATPSAAASAAHVLNTCAPGKSVSCAVPSRNVPLAASYQVPAGKRCHGRSVGCQERLHGQAEAPRMAVAARR